MICGGPPCQGISGFNRFRDKENPLNDDKNKQLVVFMDFVQFLKPKYVLMENVVDLVKFSDGSLGRYALGRLVDMNYQVRMGLMAAGAYGLPQFRMRVFLWGAQPAEVNWHNCSHHYDGKIIKIMWPNELFAFCRYCLLYHFPLMM